MTSIHPSAIVEADAIGEGVTIGEFAIVRPGAVLGDGVAVLPHAVVDAKVEIGAGTEVQVGAYLGRRPRATSGVAIKPTYRETLRIGAGCAIGTYAVVYYDVEIGDDTLVGDHAGIREETRIGSHCVVGRYSAIANRVEVGDGTVLQFAVGLATPSRVGRNVYIGPRLTTTNDNTIGRADWSESGPEGATIEDRARIGADVTFLPGITIGKGAMVAARSLVTRDVEPGVTVMGTPARPR